MKASKDFVNLIKEDAECWWSNLSLARKIHFRIWAREQPATRVKWDIYWNIRQNKKEQYDSYTKDLKDSHIDTALKRGLSNVLSQIFLP